MKQEKSAGAVVFTYEKNEPLFLLLKNTLKTTYWEFPKGKIEAEESIEETVKREVEEETGLKNLLITPGFEHKIRWFFRFKGELIQKEAVYLLIETEEKNKVKISSEHQEFKWMDFQEAMKKINIKSNKEMIEKAYEFIKENKKQKTLF